MCTGLCLLSCKHDPFFTEDDLIPQDTVSNPVDTTVIDPAAPPSAGEPCDPGLIYFKFQVLPLLRSNCALSGCHNAASAQKGVILDSYNSVITTADVEAFDLDKSDLYEVVVEEDEKDRMPPSPRAPLSASQIQIIADWILQGAKDLDCDPEAEACNTTEVSFSEEILPILQHNCTGCHGGSAPTAGIDLSTYAAVVPVAESGKLLGVITHQPGFPKMPQGGEQLLQCDIDRIRSWIDAGALDN